MAGNSETMEVREHQPLSTDSEGNNQEQSSPPASVLKQTTPGVIFQVKLLTLFLVRGLLAKYSEFELETENRKRGGYFDDLIFSYCEHDSNSKRRDFCKQNIFITLALKKFAIMTLSVTPILIWLNISSRSK